MMSSKLIFHIGYPKAASTTLQKQLFNRHSQINNLGVLPTNNIGQDTDYIDHDCEYLSNPHLQQFYDDMVMLEGIQYAQADSHKYFENHIADLVSSTDLNVFSNERYTSVFYAHDDLREKARRIHEIAPNAKILIIIRNQFDLIKSQYRDHPMDPRSFAIGDPVDIDEWISRAKNSNTTHFLESLQYSATINHYEELFGSDCVGVFMIEQLADDTDKFSRDLARFLDIDPDEASSCLRTERENTGVTSQFNTYRRVRRRFVQALNLTQTLPQFVKPIAKAIDSQIKQTTRSRGNKESYNINNNMSRELRSLYSEGNRQLANEYSLPIKDYDYPMDRN